MSNQKEVTIYDIANKLRLSATTVSRALRNHPRISKKTKQKVFEMAEKTGYRTNLLARNLRQRSTKTIGVIVHELNSTFITSVLAGIEKITAEAGYDLLIGHSSESAAKEIGNAKNMFHKRVDGLLASLSFDTENLDHYKPFVEKGIPVIFFDRVEQASDRTVVVIDNTKCGYLATQHLIQQGCKRIAHVTSNLKRNVYRLRCKGYQDALYDYNIPIDESLIKVSDLSENAGIEAAMWIMGLTPFPDGVFITNDFVAAVFIRTLKEHGVSIPDDIAVVGFNNDAIGKLIEPSLTTINYPGIDVGEVAARHLINHISGVSSIHQMNTIVVRSELIVRDSSLKRARIR